MNVGDKVLRVRDGFYHTVAGRTYTVKSISQSRHTIRLVEVAGSYSADSFEIVKSIHHLDDRLFEL